MSDGPVIPPLGAAVEAATQAIDAALMAMVTKAQAPSPGTPAAPAPPGSTGAGPAAATTETPAPSQSPTSAPPPAEAAPHAALTAMVAQAAAEQGGLAPLLADLAAALPAPDLPAPARAAAAAILATQTPLTEAVTPEGLRSAAQSSGLFLEANLAAEALNPGAAAPLTGDLKALLVRLIADLAPTPAPTPPGSPAPAAERPPPPVRGGATQGQPAALPAADIGAGGARLIHALRQDAHAALARVQLAQAASLPKPGAPTLWSLEAPVATPAGAAIAQFEISRDGHAIGPDAAAQTWRARFSLNVEPSGPVHAEVALSGGRTRVTLWAERPDALASLGARQGELSGALAADDAAADVAVRVLPGAPARTPPKAGQLVDRRS